MAAADEPRVVFPEFFVPGREHEIAWVGMLEDLVVEFGDGSMFHLNVCTIERLEREVEENAKRGRPFFSKPGLLVVSDITRWILTIAVSWLHSQGYFGQLTPVSKERLSIDADLLLPASFDKDIPEFDQRGYVEGLIASTGGSSRLPICLMIPLRLRQDITEDAMNGRPFFAEPGLIAVNEISRDIAVAAVREVAKEGAFRNLKPIAGSEE